MFRDYLVRNSEAAAEYAGIKVKLEKEFKTNRDMYRLFKSEFVDKAIKHLNMKNSDDLAIKLILQESEN